MTRSGENPAHTSFCLKLHHFTFILAFHISLYLQAFSSSFIANVFHSRAVLNVLKSAFIFHNLPVYVVVLNESLAGVTFCHSFLGIPAHRWSEMKTFSPKRKTVMLLKLKEKRKKPICLLFFSLREKSKERKRESRKKESIVFSFGQRWLWWDSKHTLNWLKSVSIPNGTTRSSHYSESFKIKS